MFNGIIELTYYVFIMQKKTQLKYHQNGNRLLYLLSRAFIMRVLIMEAFNLFFINGISVVS